MAKVSIELDLDNEIELLKLRMMLKAESIFLAIENFDNSEEVDQVAKDRLFEYFDEQKDGLIELFYD